jgi:hypothetical protein
MYSRPGFAAAEVAFWRRGGLERGSFPVATDLQLEEAIPVDTGCQVENCKDSVISVVEKVRRIFCEWELSGTISV